VLPVAASVGATPRGEFEWPTHRDGALCPRRAFADRMKAPVQSECGHTGSRSSVDVVGDAMRDVLVCSRCAFVDEGDTMLLNSYQRARGCSAELGR
jgi:hypothetical protein